MAAIQPPLLFLLESGQSVSFDDGEDVFETLEMRQAHCCQDLIQQITTSNQRNIRDLFDCKFSDLTSVLGELITHRLDHDAILPATQDDAANEEAISGTTNAMTITFPAICAAELYAHLLATPGALGSGLVALEAVTSLTAIVRRWAIECCGREDLLRDGSKGYRTSTKSPPKKRSRSGVRFDRRQDLLAGVDESSAKESTTSDPENILKAGVCLALALTKIPAEREFATWSYEAREAILEAVNTAFATAAAVKNMNKTGFEVIEEAPKSFVRAVRNCLSKPKQQEMSVALLRGLLRIMQFKEVLPNGERGKLEAHSAASACLLSLVENFSRSTTRQSLGTLRTPNRNEREARNSPISAAKTGGKTPKSQRRRASLDGVTPMLSPALKKGVSSATDDSSASANRRNPVLSVLLGMMQKLTTSPGFERAGTRTPTVKTIQGCLSLLPMAERAHFLRYIFKLCQSKVSIHRLVACEIIGNALGEEWLEMHGEDLLIEDEEASPMSVAEGAQQSLPTALWRALQGRLLDRIAAVRARAASSLEAAININARWMEESLLTVLRKRALSDETATVRKASLTAITQILLVRKEWMSEWHLSALCELCQDPSILTRKAAAESLTTLLQAYSEHHCNSLLEESWSNCVLPMVLDEEVGAKAIALLDRLVISPILSEGEMNEGQTMWRILGHVGSATGRQGASKGPSQALQAALKQLSVEDKHRVHVDLLKHTVQLAHKAMDEDKMSDGSFVGIWCLLENLLVQCNDFGSAVNKSQNYIRSLEVCLAAWKRILDQQACAPIPSFRGTLRSSLVVASQLAKFLDHSVVAHNKQELRETLKQFLFPPNTIPAAVSALVAMTVRASKTGKLSDIESCIRCLYDRCEAELTSFVQCAGSNPVGTTNLQNSIEEALFTVGELSMIGFSSEENDTNTNVSDAERDSVQAIRIRPTKNLVELVQIFLSSELPGSKGMKNPELYRAHAFTVLGKLCLRDEALTKASLNLLARELQLSARHSSPAIQSNALLVLGDLSVRYTNMTDRYLPVIATCLQAGAVEDSEVVISRSRRDSAVVRRHAVLLLSSLLLQDYIKWRGLLFHRFLVACSDDDEGVAHLADSVLSGPLWTRNPKLFYNHFVESIFVLNKCTAHPIYVAAVTQGDGGSGIAVGFEGINLGGEVGKLQRRNMYDFMLSKLSDEEKIGVTARLAKEVLGGALSENGDLGKVCQVANTETHPQLESAWNVMNDVFYVLTSGGINIGRVVEGDELEDPNVPNSSRQVTVAKSRLLSKISRKQMIEIVLPILCNLKVKLQYHCSPLLKDLMRYLCEIFQRFKTEAKEFLANDPTLLHEIEYDMRQMR